MRSVQKVHDTDYNCRHIPVQQSQALACTAAAWQVALLTAACKRGRLRSVVYCRQATHQDRAQPAAGDLLLYFSCFEMLTAVYLGWQLHNVMQGKSQKPHQDRAQPAAGDLLLQAVPQGQRRVRVVDLDVAAVVQDAQAL